MLMFPSSEDSLRCSEHTGEMCESMLDINPECAEDLCKFFNNMMMMMIRDQLQNWLGKEQWYGKGVCVCVCVCVCVTLNKDEQHNDDDKLMSPSR